MPAADAVFDCRIYELTNLRIYGSTNAGRPVLNSSIRKFVISTIASVPVHRVGRERRQADGHVLGTIRLRRAVANPLSRRRDDSLSGAYVEASAFVLHTHESAQHDGDLLELGPLSRLQPSGRRSHAGNTERAVAAVDAADELFDPLRFRPGGLHDRRSFDETGHGPP